MRRVTVRVVVAALVAGVLSPLPLTATAAPASADTTGATTTIAGGGRGLSGPASRAALGGNNPRIDAAPDGSVLTTDDNRVLRVRPDSDSVGIVPGTAVASGQGPVIDVAAAGSSVVFATPSGVQRAASDGSTVQLLDRTGVRALDVGADGVVWVATAYDVLRILPSGAVLSVTTAASHFSDAIDLTVTPDGSRVYVLENGYGRYGVYQVTATGVGARVAGNLLPDDGTLNESPLQESTSQVRSISTDGTDIVMSQPAYSRTGRFTIGGLNHYFVAFGACTQGVAYRGDRVVLSCRSENTPQIDLSLHLSTVDGADLGRILGVDPDQPWSPDGVLAADAYLDKVRGAAGLPDGRAVFTTENGLVRDVGTDGRLHTRARLAPMESGGKVAVATDGTAYVVTDAGGVVRVPVSGAPVPLTIDADATDVEVRPDGTLVVADGRGHRLLSVPSDGGRATVLTEALDMPADIGLDGDTVLVADTGLRRVASDGTVTSVLTGGAPTTAARTTDGIWTDPLIVDNQHRPQVLLPSGALAPVRATVAWPFAQVQAVGNGDVLVSSYTSVQLVTDPGLPTVAPFSITATPAPGRIDLAWDATGVSDVMVVAKHGTSPPADRWDGVGLGNTHSVPRVLADLLQAGDRWSFAVFAHTALDTWSAPATATAAALADTDPPMPPDTPTLTATPTAIVLTWGRPADVDFDHAVARIALGTTPPATPDDGAELTIVGQSWVQVPDPIPGQDYALSIFGVDLRGNFSRWSTVARLDTEPPAQVTDLAITPSYASADVTFTAPADADYAGVDYALAPGTATPSHNAARSGAGPGFSLASLTMGSDYTLAVWSRDRVNNVSAPVLTHFTTLLDTQPPGPVTALALTGGPYQVTAAWTLPSDTDVDTLAARLTDVATGAVSTATLGPTATGYTWSALPGDHSYSVAVTATDIHGLVSDVSTGTVGTDPDTNGAPPAIDPATVVVTPRSSTAVTVSFPRPDIPDLRSLSYAVVPLGQDPRLFGATHSLPTGSSPVIGTVTLPSANTGYQLVLSVMDLNLHQVRSVVPEVKGAVNATDLPAAATGVTVTSPVDNTVGLSWAIGAIDSLKVTSWTVTASSGSLTRSVTLTPSSRQAGFDDLAGRRDWTVSVVGNNAAGSGPVVTAGPVAVADDSAPAPVTQATRAPSFDSEVLSWVNPTAFDFDHVDVTRLGPTAGQSQLVYRGAGSSVRASGLLPDAAYTFEIRAYDEVGNVAEGPVALVSTQTRLTLGVPSAVHYGGTAVLTGVLLWKGARLGGRVVSIQAQPAGTTTWTQVATSTTTSATGSFSAAVRPAINTRYRVAYAGSGETGGTYSASYWVKVAPAVSIQSSRTSVTLGGTVTFTTTVSPTHPGGAVLLQRWNGSFWATVWAGTLSSRSGSAVIVRPTGRGTNSYCWATPSDPAHDVGRSAASSVLAF